MCFFVLDTHTYETYDWYKSMEVKVMTKIAVSDARDHLSEVVDRARYSP
jgi:hypothetical protein